MRTIGWRWRVWARLILLHTFNFRRCGLPGAPVPCRRQEDADVAISFIIPTVILLIIFSQMRAFFGYRFNLTNLVRCATRCPMSSC